MPGVPPSRTPAQAEGAVAPRTMTEGADWFVWTQQRLRELGATYYVLETWGPGGGQYRFHCKMAIGGNPDQTRHFEATDANPARAMQMVLQQVEASRAGQPP